MKTLVLIFATIFCLFGLTLGNPLYTSCSNSGGEYSSNDHYAQNLDKLASYLLYKVKPNGFGVATAGNGNSKAYGLALCRGDISSSICSKCIQDAGKQLRKACPTKKEAITWYDNCMVRYAARDFFGSVELFKVYVWNRVEVSNPKTFNEKVVNLLKRVSSEAYGDEEKLFGMESADVVVDGMKQKVYSLAQCTRDISPKECKSCLKNILKDLPKCCNAKRGGRVLTPSCNFRYELYRFY